tara:strand:+ start:254 stop:394 length:141 start_codon:yes stop_codon:yes gene_type:complete
MQVDELASKDGAHAVNVSSVSPVRVVYACEGYAFFLALESREHHMG